MDFYMFVQKFALYIIVNLTLPTPYNYAKKAIIFDLDNTLFAAASIGKLLFAQLLKLIVADEKHNEQIEQIKKDILQKPS